MAGLPQHPEEVARDGAHQVDRHPWKSWRVTVISTSPFLNPVEGFKHPTVECSQLGFLRNPFSLVHFSIVQEVTPPPLYFPGLLSSLLLDRGLLDVKQDILSLSQKNSSYCIETIILLLSIAAVDVQTLSLLGFTVKAESVRCLAPT